MALEFRIKTEIRELNLCIWFQLVQWQTSSYSILPKWNVPHSKGASRRWNKQDSIPAKPAGTALPIFE